jgi:hypothetical protein
MGMIYRAWEKLEGVSSKFSSKILIETDHTEDSEVDGRMILKQILEK